MSKKPKSCLSSLIAKTLAKNNCNMHQQSISQLCLNTLKLGCSQCQFGNAMNIEQAVRNPIQVAIGHMQQSNKKFNQLRDQMKNIQDHKKIKVGFETMIQQIKKQVAQLCDSILEQFRSRWQNAFESTVIKINQIRQAEIHYRAVFQELLQLNFRNGDGSELQTIMNQFCNQFSQDPTEYLNTRIEDVLKCQELMPLVEWENVKNIYEVVTDSSLWQVQNIIKPCMRDELKANYLQKQYKLQNSTLLVPQVGNKLKNGKYILNFNNKMISLYEKQQNQPKQISRLNIGMDSFYEIDKYRLIGINYEQISIYSYSLGSLRLLNTYPIKACSNLLVYSDCLIAETEGRIIRLWLIDGYKQIISLSGSNLEYGHDNIRFKFTDGREQIITHSVFHNEV